MNDAERLQLKFLLWGMSRHEVAHEEIEMRLRPDQFHLLRRAVSAVLAPAHHDPECQWARDLGCSCVVGCFICTIV